MTQTATRLILLSAMPAALFAAGCAQTSRSAALGAPAFSHYHVAEFDWRSVRRALLVPLVNETADPRVADELRSALAAELQSLGQFEIVLTAPEARVACSVDVRAHGSFDEIELLELAGHYQVDAVLFGTVTHYQAYAPPRIGVSLRLIDPSEAIVLASVDGVWDARDELIAEHARAYRRDVLAARPKPLGDDAVLSSPHLYQRFVACAAARALLGAGLK